MPLRLTLAVPASLVCFCLAIAHAQNPTAITLTVTAPGNPAPSLTPITMGAAVVSGAIPILHGQVHFCEVSASGCADIPNFGLAQLTSNGTANIKFIPGPGTHTYKAIFAGTDSAQASTSAASSPFTVSYYDPITIAYGGGVGDYSLSADINAAYTAVPSGTVSFVDTSNANYILGSATLLPGLGSFGTTKLITAYQSQPLGKGPMDAFACNVGIGAADFDGDGKLDIVLGDQSVVLLDGNLQATFTPESYIPVAGPWACAIVVGDFNQDGRPDFVMTQAPSAFQPPLVTDYTTVYSYVEINNGDGTYSRPQSITGTGAPYLATGDFNGDGIPDLVFSAGGTEALGATIYLGNGDGTFIFRASYVTGGAGQAIVGDFNADGKADLALQNAGGNYVLYLGNGDGTFTASTTPPPSGLAPPPLIGDFTGAGYIDTATSYFLPPLPPPGFPLAPYPPATGALITQTIPPLQAAFTDVASPTASHISIVGTGTHLIAARYNGDSTYLPSLSAAIPLQAEPVPTTLSLTANPTTINQFKPVALTATLAPNTAQNHNATGTVTFKSGTTVLGAASIAAGVATLTTTTLPAGIDSVTASYAGDDNFAPSTSAPVTVAVTLVDFTVSLANPTVSLEAQHHTTTPLTLTSLNGFTDSIAIAYGKLPTFVTCLPTPTPAPLAANGATSISLYLDTDAVLGFARNTTPSAPAHPVLPPATLALSLVAGLATLRKGRSRMHLLLLTALAIPLTLALTGCGEIILPPSATLPGSYAIPITATGAATGITHSVNLTLTVTR